MALSGKSFFTRGFDVAAVKEDLSSQAEDRQLSALQQVVAFMTVGKDMSGLFVEVAAVTSSTNMLMKRLAYLYLIQNSRAQPEKAVLQAGTFVRDTLHNSPLVRGAALRAMTNLQLGVMADFAIGPVRRCLDDDDPYVRRCAVMAALKYFSVASNAAQEISLIEKLAECLEDDNHAVTAACVQASLEMLSRGAPISLRQALVAARPYYEEKLAECTEWGAHYLLEGIAYAMGTPRDPAVMSAAVWLAEAERTLMTVMPFIFIDNSAVSMSAIKVVALFLVTLHEDAELGAARERLEKTYAENLVRALIAKLEAPRYELRYFFIRNMLVFLHTHLRVFFAPHLIEFLIKYDDPIFIKLEKVNILIALADEESGQKVLNELVIYVRDSDTELSSKTVRAIGTIAARVPALAPACVVELQKLIATKVPRIVEDAAIVLHTILRYFPGRYVDVVPTLCEALTVLNNVDAEAAIVWIVGENAKLVPGAIGNYISLFTENFLEQPRMVQLAVLTALAKIYVRDDDQWHMKDAAYRLLTQICTESLGSSYPDLRDRALFYTRLLSNDLAAAKRVLGVTEMAPMDPPSTALLMGASEREVLSELGSLVVVEQKTLAVLLGDGAVGAYRLGENENSESDEDEEKQQEAAGSFPAVTDIEGERRGQQSPSRSPTVPSPSSRGPTPASPSGPLKGPLVASNAYEVLLPASAGNGVEISTRWSQMGTRLVLLCRLQLHEGSEYVHQARVLNIQVNRNIFSLGIAQAFPVTVLEPEEKPAELSLIMSRNNERRPTRDIQLAAEISPIGIRYFTAPPIPPTMLLLPSTGIDRGVFLDTLKEHPNVSWTMPPQMTPLRCDPVRITVNAMRVHAFDLVHRKEFYTSNNATLNAFFFYAETLSRQKLLFELTFDRDEVLLLTARAEYAPIAAFFGEHLMHVVQFIGSSVRALR